MGIPEPYYAKGQEHEGGKEHTVDEYGIAGVGKTEDITKFRAEAGNVSSADVATGISGIIASAA